MLTFPLTAARGLSALLVLLFVLAPGAAAKKAKPGETYLSAAELAPVLALAEPPVKGSNVEAAEVEDLLKIQAARTPEAAREAEDDAERTPKRFLRGTGIEFAKDRTPLVHKLLTVAGGELRRALDSAKARWQRQRPFLAHDRVKPCERNRPSSQSYPSGHAALGALYGELLASLMPDKADIARKRGEDYGWSRVICGFHYPSDVAAGRLAGLAMAKALLANAAFKADFAAAEAELKAAR